MLITGFIELLRFNALGATAFCTYGSFWITVGVYGIIRMFHVTCCLWMVIFPLSMYRQHYIYIYYYYIGTAGIFFLQSPHGEQALTALFGIASFVFMIVSVALNLSLPFLFLNLTIMFFLLAGGVRSITCAKVAGWWGIWTSGLAFYNGVAILFRDSWGRDVLPQFFTKIYLAHEKVLFPRVHVEVGHEDENETLTGNRDVEDGGRRLGILESGAVHHRSL